MNSCFALEKAHKCLDVVTYLGIPFAAASLDVVKLTRDWPALGGAANGRDWSVRMVWLDWVAAGHWTAPSILTSFSGVQSQTESGEPAVQALVMMMSACYTMLGVLHYWGIPQSRHSPSVISGLDGNGFWTKSWFSLLGLWLAIWVIIRLESLPLPAAFVVCCSCLNLCVEVK